MVPYSLRWSALLPEQRLACICCSWGWICTPRGAPVCAARVCCDADIQRLVRLLDLRLPFYMVIPTAVEGREMRRTRTCGKAGFFKFLYRDCSDMNGGSNYYQNSCCLVAAIAKLIASVLSQYCPILAGILHVLLVLLSLLHATLQFTIQGL